MNYLATAAAFFGWATVINFVLLLLAVLAITFLRRPIAKIHGKMFGMSETELAPLYFHYAANYKLLIITFNLVPYIALKLIS
jgi:hypothetical protein